MPEHIRRADLTGADKAITDVLSELYERLSGPVGSWDALRATFTNGGWFLHALAERGYEVRPTPESLCKVPSTLLQDHLSRSTDER